MAYYENSRPWAAIGAPAAWNDLDIDSQTVRSGLSPDDDVDDPLAYTESDQFLAGSSSTVPTQTSAPPSQGPETVAFSHQMEEVDRAIDNLVKSGKMFGMPGRRKSFSPDRSFQEAPPELWYPNPLARDLGNGRQGHGAGPRPHSMAEFGDARGAHQSNLQNFYASQRHQSSRGSSEAEQMIQAKRRMAAQRERELRNYHQEQQYNRTVLAELSSYGGKPDRTLSPGSMSETERRDLIARQRSALYGEGPFAETGGYIDETGTPRPGVPGPQHGPPGGIRGHSPLAYEYGRVPPPADGTAPPDAASGSPSAGPGPSSRTNSTSSPQSNLTSNDLKTAQTGQPQVSRTTTSSPGTSPINGKPASGGSASAVAPIGTRPSASTTPSVSSGAVGAATNASLSKLSTTPLASPMAYAPGANETGSTGGGVSTNSASATPEDGPLDMTGWGRGGSVWGNGSKPGMGVQASVWG